MAALLQQIGRREVHQHATRRQCQAHRTERGADPFARLADRLVGQADHQEVGQAGGDLHLHLDPHGLDAGEGEGLDAGDDRDGDAGVQGLDPERGGGAVQCADR